MSIYEGFDPSQVPEPFGDRQDPKHPPADMAGLDGLIERLREQIGLLYQTLTYVSEASVCELSRNAANETIAKVDALQEQSK